MAATCVRRCGVGEVRDALQRRAYDVLEVEVGEERREKRGDVRRGVEIERGVR